MKRLFLNLPDLKIAYFDQLNEGIQHFVLNHKDWYVKQLHNYEFTDKNSKININKACLSSQSYDALITYAYDQTDYELFKEINSPTVILDPDAYHDDFFIISADYVSAFDEGIQHLHACGYELIMMVNQNFYGSQRLNQLQELFHQKCASLNLEIKLFNHLNFEQEFSSFLNETNKKAAFCTQVSKLAHFVIQQAILQNKAIPEQFGLLSFTSLSPTHPQYNAYTAVEVDAFHLGYKAAEMAIQWAESNQRPKNIPAIKCHHLAIEATTQKTAFRHPEVSSVLAYIDQNYTKGILLKDVFDQLKVSRKTIERHFKTELNCSPNEYLINKKFDRVKSLLSQSSLPIGLVAVHAGFNNVAYMTRQFKRRFNITPREYRKSHRV